MLNIHVQSWLTVDMWMEPVPPCLGGTLGYSRVTLWVLSRNPMITYKRQRRVGYNRNQWEAAVSKRSPLSSTVPSSWHVGTRWISMLLVVRYHSQVRHILQLLAHQCEYWKSGDVVFYIFLNWICQSPRILNIFVMLGEKYVPKPSARPLQNIWKYRSALATQSNPAQIIHWHSDCVEFTLD